MNYKLIAALVLFAIAVPGDGIRASADRQTHATTASKIIVLKLSDLRSAHLIRAGVVRYDATPDSPDAVRAQLQRHFDVVLGLLLAATPQSIDTALTRLEESSNENWSKAERADWRKRLLTMRCVQLQRLAEYRDRGRFPLNEGQSIQPAPIFVDAHDTACAVGQLMRWTGREREVEGIHSTNNLVYVPDASQTALAAWVLTSGLTIEEAALIQPGYAYPSDFVLTDYPTGGATIVKDGLRYQNFEMVSDNYSANSSSITNLCAITPSSCNISTFMSLEFLSPVSDGAIPDPSKVGALIRTGNPPSPAWITIQGNRWIGIGGTTTSPPYPPYNRGLQGSAVLGRAQHIVISFDISTDSPDSAINLVGEHSNDFYGGFSNIDGSWPVPTTGAPLYFMTTTLSNEQGTLASVVLNRTTPHDADASWNQSSNASFAPQSHAHVRSIIWVLDGVRIDGVVLDFNLVPEPSTVLLGGPLLALVGVRPRRVTIPSTSR